ncbi:MAG TPA: phenylacetic acid degradation protein PaaN [Chitinophagales bacterium]|nr:phenylacetic acid degradation protein PaaN [Chitinophagales bacterium]
MQLSEQQKNSLDKAITAIQDRNFYAHHPEHPGAYGEEAANSGKAAFEQQLNKPFTQLLQTGTTAQAGDETSPYTGQKLGITYPTTTTDTLINNANTAFEQWRKTTPDTRAALLIEALEQIKNRYHEIAHATMHTTGQSFVMSFQASGPHAADRAMETLALAYQELTRFPAQKTWTKPMGKFAIQLQKTFTPIPHGIGLVIGCSTFPTWNSVPGLFADLMTGNTAIVKPHPLAILPIAIFVAEIQQTLQKNGFNPNIVQLAVDTPDQLITKQLAEHPNVRLIDYTGGNTFGDYVESLPNKITFTEKAGVNSVIIDSVRDLREVMRNLAFSVSLYSGQMCTAPQNLFIPEGGITTTDNENIPFETVVDVFKNEVAALVLNPKMGAGTLGAIQNPHTLERAKNAAHLGATVVLSPLDIKDAIFPDSRLISPTILQADATQTDIYQQELFGPIVVIVKTRNTEHSTALAKAMAAKHGAITCAAYTTSNQTAQQITDEMNQVFAPVSLNLTGFIWVNQHAAFSDFHVTGGNPAGNASFTDPNYVNKRFVWVGNRSIA